jgi:hypothetical protein
LFERLGVIKEAARLNAYIKAFYAKVTEILQRAHPRLGRG